ncbi:MAG: chorismate synthase [Mariniblastus sp.]|jgi:chorismate synthase
MLRYWTAGESHGKCLLALIDGFPAGFEIDTAKIDELLVMRQGGYGRGQRQRLEQDHVDILTGVWKNVTLGAPITLQVPNNDYKLERLKELPRPRPGHGDLSGSIKYMSSMRGILERASARETCVRVAAGALCQQLLESFGIRTLGYVVQLGGHKIPATEGTFDERLARRNQSIIYSLDPAQDEAAKQLVDETKKAGDTLGGIIEVVVEGLPFGLGTHAQWDRKLDGKLAQAVMAVQAIKGVEIGMGFEAATLPGSQVHDGIQFNPDQAETANLGYTRPTNNAGGLEAGMTNGQPLVIRAAKKPISTLQKPLESIDMETKEPSKASYERSDVCALSAASIIIEAVVAFEIAAAMVDKFGGDSIQEMQARWDLFQKMAGEK